METLELTSTISNTLQSNSKLNQVNLLDSVVTQELTFTAPIIFYLFLHSIFTGETDG